jgi:hypothetical protein
MNFHPYSSSGALWLVSAGAGAGAGRLDANSNSAANSPPLGVPLVGGEDDVLDVDSETV